ncbi:MAG TPA: metallophosphoesterase [Polyangia bacterium]|nr:metallophosphoesterase [Polyangia bacterium]
MRTIIIGDVHGCLDELLTLVRLARREPDDRIVLVGDLVVKGPDSAGVVAWARESGVAAVLGNHDAHVLRAVAGDPDVRAPHRAVAEELSGADVDWLRARPLWLPVGDFGGVRHVVVHGGFVPGVPLDDQERDVVLNLRSITPKGKPSKKQDGTPWAALWPGPEHVVFGHDAVRGLQRHPFATGLDTGCVYGKQLTALVLPEGQLVSVPAARAYAAMS